MAPILAAVASMFAQEGLNLLAGTVKAGGEKAVQLIEKKTGINIKDAANPETKTQLQPEHIEKLRSFEKEEVLSLARMVADADKEKGINIILASLAPEVPEMILFCMGLLMVLGFAVWGKPEIATNIASTWLGAFAMYIKGK